MITFTPTGDNLFIVETTSKFNCSEILSRADQLMENGDITAACQLRMDAATTCLDALYDYEETPELLMTNATNMAFLEIIFASGVDHYMIGDYEVSSAMLESLLEADPEDHFGATIYMGFNFAALAQWTDMLEVVSLLDEKSSEYQFLTIFKAKSLNKPVAPLHPALKRALNDPMSKLENYLIPLSLSSNEAVDAIRKMAE